MSTSFHLHPPTPALTPAHPLSHSGLNFKFLVSKSGELINPQNKIVAALAEVTLGNMMIRYEREREKRFDSCIALISYSLSTN